MTTRYEARYLWLDAALEHFEVRDPIEIDETEFFDARKNLVFYPGTRETLYPETDWFPFRAKLTPDHKIHSLVIVEVRRVDE